MDFIINANFQDFDLFASEAQAWELDFVQLDSGMPSFDLLLSTVGEVQITRAKFSRKLYQQGATPKWGRTFVIPMNPEQDLQWFGQRVTGDDLLIFPDNAELVSLSLPQFDVVTYTVSHEFLAELCDGHELGSVDKLLNFSPVIKLERKTMDGLRSTAMQLTRPIEKNDERVLLRSSFREALVRDLAGQILQLVSYNKSPIRRSKPEAHLRSACVKLTIDLLRQGKVGGNVRDLCALTHASERTLQYAFKEQFGMTPKGFMKAWKLNQVKSMLLLNNAHASISEVAGEFGFWHMGQFAADYRKLFGELPSATQLRST